MQIAVWGGVATLLGAYLVAFALSAVTRLLFPAEFAYGEAIVLEGARRVARGEPLYPPPDRLPLLVTAYMPLYYSLVGMLQRLLGDGYLAGRAISLLASLAASALLAWSVRTVTGRWWAGVLAAAVFLTQNMTVLFWAPLHRVDTLALCFTLAGLSFATRKRPLLAVAPFLLALGTKQSYLVAPLTVWVALWPRGGEMLRFAAFFAAGAALLLVLGQAGTAGWFVWYTVQANANAFRLEYLLAQLGPFAKFNAIPLALAGSLFLLPTRPGEWLWRLYFLATLVTLPAIGKVGASSNYWLELTAATSALIGMLAVRLAEFQPGLAVRARSALGAALLVALLVVMPGYQSVIGEALTVLPSGGAGPVRAQLELANVVAAEAGDVLTDDPSLAVASGKPVLFEFVIFRLLAEQGLWDERPIVEAIASRRFALVALRAPLEARLADVEWTAAVRDAIRGAYVPVGQAAGYWFYRPSGSVAAIDEGSLPGAENWHSSTPIRGR